MTTGQSISRLQQPTKENSHNYTTIVCYLEAIQAIDEDHRLVHSLNVLRANIEELIMETQNAYYYSRFYMLAVYYMKNLLNTPC